MPVFPRRVILVLFGCTAFCRTLPAAQTPPAGFIDPLFEHRCNVILAPDLVQQPKSIQRARLAALDADYREGMARLAQGEAQEALGSFLAYLETISKYVAPTHHLYLDTVHQIITARLQLHDYNQALPDAQLNYQKRNECYGSDNPFTLESLALLGLLYSSMGQSKLALTTTEAVLAGETRLVAAMPPGSAATPRVRKQLLIARANVLTAAYRLDDFKRAAVIAPQIINGADELAADDPDRWELSNSSWYALDRIAQRENRAPPPEAIAGLKMTYESLVALLGRGHPQTLPLLANYGFALADIDAARALPVLGDYVALAEQDRLRMRLPADRGVLLEGRAGAYQRFAFAAADAGQVLDSFNGVELSKARSLRDAVALRLAIVGQALPPGDAAALTAAERRVSELESQLESGPSGQQRQATAARLQVAKTDFARLVDSAAANSPRFRTLTQSRIQSPANVRQILHADEVFLSYLTRRVYGFLSEVLVVIAEPSGKVSVASLGNVAGLDGTIEAYSSALSRTEGIDAIARSGSEVWGVGQAFFLAPGGAVFPQAQIVTSIEPMRVALSEQLLPQPLRQILSPYRRWIVSPAGALWSVPFETLADGDGLVVDHHSVRYVHSWTMLTTLAAAADAARPETLHPLLAIGDAKYSDFAPPPGASQNEYAPWPDLPYSASEIETVARHFSLVDGTTLFRGAAAVRQTVLNLNASHQLARARVLLLSAHGYLDMQNSARSALVLGRPVGGSEADRYLRARDLAFLDLPPGLIIVASCKSGQGRIASGEGMLGLPYALFAAGATSSVLTRWDVYDDPVTARLVSDLVIAVASGRSPDEALAEIERKVKKTANEAHWAALLLVGR